MSALASKTEATDPEQVRHGVCEFLGSMSEELCLMAYDNGFDSQAIIFEMARADAKRIRTSSDKHCDRR